MLFRLLLMLTNAAGWDIFQSLSINVIVALNALILLRCIIKRCWSFFINSVYIFILVSSFLHLFASFLSVSANSFARRSSNSSLPQSVSDTSAHCLRFASFAGAGGAGAGVADTVDDAGMSRGLDVGTET